MRVHYTSQNGRVRVEFDSEGQKGLFLSLAAVAVVLEAEACGQCQSENVVHEHRIAQGFDYYSFRCTDCGAQLSLGQYRDGKGLFIKRHDENGNPRGKDGWYHYQQGSGGGSRVMTQTTGQQMNDDQAQYGAPYQEEWDQQAPNDQQQYDQSGFPR